MLYLVIYFFPSSELLNAYSYGRNDTYCFGVIRVYTQGNSSITIYGVSGKRWSPGIYWKFYNGEMCKEGQENQGMYYNK